MRTGKILGGVVGGLIALFAIALMAVWLLVNPNDYKPQIVAAVKRSTGRDLALGGDLKLSVFPWVALETGPASLSNPPGFSADPFVAFTHASVRVKLLPLLAKRLEIGRVAVDGLDLRLLKNAQGKGNWEGFGSGSGEAPASTADSRSGGGEFEGIAGVKLMNARVSYENIVLSRLSVETGAFVERGTVPVTLHLEANRGVRDENASLDMRFDLSADPATKRYRFAALNLNSVVALAGNPRPVRWSVSSPAIDVDLAAQTLSAKAFAVNAAGAEINGSVEGTQIVDALRLTGSVALTPLVLHEYLPRLGITLPKTRDARALSQASFSGEFAYGGNAARIDKLAATLDDTHVTGNVAVALDTHAVAFDLAVDTLDVDRYLAPAGEPATAPPPTPASAAGSAAASAPLDANGTLSIGSVHVAPLDLADVKVTVATKDRATRIFPLKAQVDGGQYSGDVTVDNRTNGQTMSLDEHLTGIDVGKLLASSSRSVRVTGRGNVDLKATAHGVGADALMKSLNGQFDANVANGAVEGIDLGYQLSRAESLIKRQDVSGSGPDTKRTKFDVFKMTADIADGVATSKDLTISSAVIKITGEGSANLAAKTLDFALLADTLRSAGGVPIQVPVKVTGTFADPRVTPDVEALAKGALRQKVQEVLQDKLKGLFGKP